MRWLAPVVLWLLAGAANGSGTAVIQANFVLFARPPEDASADAVLGLLLLFLIWVPTIWGGCFAGLIAGLAVVGLAEVRPNWRFLRWAVGGVVLGSASALSVATSGVLGARPALVLEIWPWLYFLVGASPVIIALAIAVSTSRTTSPIEPATKERADDTGNR